METENGGFPIWPALFRDENGREVQRFLHRLRFFTFRRRRSGSTRDCTFLPNLKKTGGRTGNESNVWLWTSAAEREAAGAPFLSFLFIFFILLFSFQDWARKRFRDYQFVMSSKYCMFHVSLSCWELATRLCFLLFPSTKRRFVLKQRRIILQWQVKSCWSYEYFNNYDSSSKSICHWTKICVLYSSKVIFLFLFLVFRR